MKKQKVSCKEHWVCMYTSFSFLTDLLEHRLGLMELCLGFPEFPLGFLEVVFDRDACF